MLRAHDGDVKRRAETLTQVPGSRQKRVALQHLRLPNYQQGVERLDRSTDNIQGPIDDWLRLRLRSDIAPNTSAEAWRST
eukprot:368552-Amphidinium_carterae.1